MVNELKRERMVADLLLANILIHAIIELFSIPVLQSFDFQILSFFSGFNFEGVVVFIFFSRQTLAVLQNGNNNFFMTEAVII